MPSPFPGMDPFIETYEWPDFHGAMIFAIRAQLAPKLRPDYVVQAEDRLYLERSPERDYWIGPDVLISKKPNGGQKRPAAASAVMDIEPEIMDVPAPEQYIEHYLVIRDRKQREVVTVIEVLSPGNKRPGSDGYREYHQKREELLGRRVNLVEIDLLRGGERPLTIQPLRDTTDYCVLVHRGRWSGRAEAYQWTLRQALPVIKIPLAGDDPDVVLELQNAFRRAYDEGQYDIVLDYSEPLRPPVRKGDGSWVRQTLKALKGSR
ncbi:MAG TPA: DUF4058 family protein [Pirellulaceae bacterium]|nr:DUF4058 family protein [Pirellulaceae bacterium]